MAPNFEVSLSLTNSQPYWQNRVIVHCGSELQALRVFAARHGLYVALHVGGSKRRTKRDIFDDIKAALSAW